MEMIDREADGSDSLEVRFTKKDLHDHDDNLIIRVS